jgi:hypothetical protein
MLILRFLWLDPLPRRSKQMPKCNEAPRDEHPPSPSKTSTNSPSPHPRFLPPFNIINHLDHHLQRRRGPTQTYSAVDQPYRHYRHYHLVSQDRLHPSLISTNPCSSPSRSLLLFCECPPSFRLRHVSCPVYPSPRLPWLFLNLPVVHFPTLKPSFLRVTAS